MTAGWDPVTCVLIWKDLPFLWPLVIDSFAEAAKKIILIADCCSSVTAGGDLCGVCLCLSPWWGHFLLQAGDRKAEGSLISGFHEFCKSSQILQQWTQSKTQTNYRHVCLQDMGWSFQTGHSLWSSLVISSCSADTWATLRSTAQDTA